MAEPWGCITKIKISEPALKSYLRSKRKSFSWNESFYPPFFKVINDQPLLVDTNSFKKNADFFVVQIYELKDQDSTNDIFLFHYDEDKQTVFIAIVYDQEAFPPYIQVVLEQLARLAEYKDIDTNDTCLFISPWTGDFYAAYSLKVGEFEKLDRLDVSEQVINENIDLFFSFMEKETFPSIDKALRKKNYYYKPIRAAYRKYYYQQEELDKPNKIKQSTKENPYPLFGYFYSFDNKVYERWNDYNELEGADPVTLREIKMFDFCADNQHVYVGESGRNYQRIDGIDGATFTCLEQNKEESIYWKDKNHVYLDDNKRKPRLSKIEEADVKTFRSTNGYGFARDKNHVYLKGQILPVDVKSVRLTNNAFLCDNKSVYYYGTLVPLDGATFKVLQFNSQSAPHIGPFVVADKTGLYRYDKTLGEKALEKLGDLSKADFDKIDAFKMWEIDF